MPDVVSGTIRIRRNSRSINRAMVCNEWFVKEEKEQADAPYTLRVSSNSTRSVQQKQAKDMQGSPAHTIEGHFPGLSPLGRSL